MKKQIAWTIGMVLIAIAALVPGEDAALEATAVPALASVPCMYTSAGGCFWAHAKCDNGCQPTTMNVDCTGGWMVPTYCFDCDDTTPLGG